MAEEASPAVEQGLILLNTSSLHAQEQHCFVPGLTADMYCHHISRLFKSSAIGSLTTITLLSHLPVCLGHRNEVMMKACETPEGSFAVAAALQFEVLYQLKHAEVVRFHINFLFFFIAL